jgi:two-component system chemotaxis response regulator CheB
VKAAALPSGRREGARFPLSVVATGSSAGGLHALMVVLEGLPAAFPGAVVVAQHMDPKHPSLLVGLLARRTALVVRAAEAGLKLVAGTVYVAPPDHHLLVQPNARMMLTRGEKVHFVRPAVDVLFNSVAESCCERAAAVILSGTGFDGADGCRDISRCGGHVIVQDEASSEFTGMPQSARATGLANQILPLGDIAGALVAWADGNGHG